MNNLMKQAQKMQKQMEEAQKQMIESEFTATSGGGVVEATVSGDKKIKSLKISEEAVDPDDIETLEDLIIAAVNEAFSKADAAASDSLGKISGGLGNLGGLGGGLF